MDTAMQLAYSESRCTVKHTCGRVDKALRPLWLPVDTEEHNNKVAVASHVIKQINTDLRCALDQALTRAYRSQEDARVLLLVIQKLASELGPDKKTVERRIRKLFSEAVADRVVAETDVPTDDPPPRKKPVKYTDEMIHYVQEPRETFCVVCIEIKPFRWHATENRVCCVGCQGTMGATYKQQ